MKNFTWCQHDILFRSLKRILLLTTCIFWNYNKHLILIAQITASIYLTNLVKNRQSIGFHVERWKFSSLFRFMDIDKTKKIKWRNQNQIMYRRKILFIYNIKYQGKLSVDEGGYLKKKNCWLFVVIGYLWFPSRKSFSSLHSHFAII